MNTHPKFWPVNSTTQGAYSGQVCHSDCSSLRVYMYMYHELVISYIGSLSMGMHAETGCSSLASQHCEFGPVREAIWTYTENSTKSLDQENVGRVLTRRRALAWNNAVLYYVCKNYLRMFTLEKLYWSMDTIHTYVQFSRTKTRNPIKCTQTTFLHSFINFHDSGERVYSNFLSQTVVHIQYTIWWVCYGPITNPAGFKAVWLLWNWPAGF